MVEVDVVIEVAFLDCAPTKPGTEVVVPTTVDEASVAVGATFPIVREDWGAMAWEVGPGFGTDTEDPAVNEPVIGD